MTQYTLDARGLLCPLPVIRVQDRVAALLPGDRLEAVCSDPGALNDIPAWCRLNGHRVVSAHETGYNVIVVVEVGGASQPEERSDGG